MIVGALFALISCTARAPHASLLAPGNVADDPGVGCGYFFVTTDRAPTNGSLVNMLTPYACSAAHVEAFALKRQLAFVFSSKSGGLVPMKRGLDDFEPPMLPAERKRIYDTLIAIALIVDHNGFYQWLCIAFLVLILNPFCLFTDLAIRLPSMLHGAIFGSLPWLGYVVHATCVGLCDVPPETFYRLMRLLCPTDSNAAEDAVSFFVKVDLHASATASRSVRHHVKTMVHDVVNAQLARLNISMPASAFSVQMEGKVIPNLFDTVEKVGITNGSTIRIIPRLCGGVRGGSPSSASVDTESPESPVAPAPPTAEPPSSEKQAYTPEEGCFYERFAIRICNQKLIALGRTIRLVHATEINALMRRRADGEVLTIEEMRKSLVSKTPMKGPFTKEAISREYGFDAVEIDLDNPSHLKIVEVKLPQANFHNLGGSLAKCLKTMYRRMVPKMDPLNHMVPGVDPLKLKVISNHSPTQGLFDTFDAWDGLEWVHVPFKRTPPPVEDEEEEAAEDKAVYMLRPTKRPEPRRWQRSALRKLKGLWNSNEEFTGMHMLEAVMGAGKTNFAWRALEECGRPVRIFVCHTLAIRKQVVKDADKSFNIKVKNCTCTSNLEYEREPTKAEQRSKEHELRKIEKNLTTLMKKATNEDPVYIVMCHYSLAHFARKKFKIFDGIEGAIIVDEVHRLMQTSNNAKPEKTNGKRAAPEPESASESESEPVEKRVRTDAGAVEAPVDQIGGKKKSLPITVDQKVLHNLFLKKGKLKSLGMSATLPRDWTGQSKDVQNYLTVGKGKDRPNIIVHRYGLMQALRDGVLVELMVDTVLKPDGGFPDGSKVNTIHDWIVFKELASTVVYASTIDEANSFRDLLRAKFEAEGEKAWVEVVHSRSADNVENMTYTTRNEDTLDKFKDFDAKLREYDYHIVVNVEMLAEGFDMPSLASVVFLRAPTICHRFWQMVGRTMRAHPYKTQGRALVFDEAEEGTCADMYAALVQSYAEHSRAIFHQIIKQTRDEMVEDEVAAHARGKHGDATVAFRKTVGEKVELLRGADRVSKDNLKVAKFHALDRYFADQTTPFKQHELSKRCAGLMLVAEAVDAFARDDKAPKIMKTFDAEEYVNDIRRKWSRKSKGLQDLFVNAAWWPPVHPTRPDDDVHAEVKAECKNMITKKWTCKEVEAEATKQGLTLQKNGNRYVGVEDINTGFMGKVKAKGGGYVATFPHNALGEIVAAFFFAKLSRKLGNRQTTPRGANKLSEAELQEFLTNKDFMAQLKRKRTNSDEYVGADRKDSGNYEASAWDGRKKVSAGCYSTKERAAVAAKKKQMEIDAQKASATAASSTPLPTHPREASPTLSPKHPRATPAARLRPADRISSSESDSDSDS